MNFGKYGKESAFTNIISNEKLISLNPETLTDLDKDLFNYPHRIFYYGDKPVSNVINALKKAHTLPEKFKQYPESKIFNQRDDFGGKIYYVNYDKAQVDIFLLSKDVPFSKDQYVQSSIFNEYYGNSMSSVVFQEIREAKALAYSAWAGYSSPKYKEENFIVMGVIFTQIDKMMDAINAFDDILNNMVSNEKSFDIAKSSVIKNIQTDRITKQNIFWQKERLMKLGIQTDIRKDIYEAA